MTEEFRPLTLDQIKEMYPPREEQFPVGGGMSAAKVRRNEGGKIIYVEPKSIRWIKQPSSKRGREPTE